MQHRKISYAYIDCPRYLEHAYRIDQLTRFLHREKLISGKVGMAQELLHITSGLLDCARYEADCEDCRDCHFVLRLRKESARLVVDAADIGI